MNIENKIDEMTNLVELHLHLDGALSLNNCKNLPSFKTLRFQMMLPL